MTVREGDRIKSILTEKTYVVKMIKDSVAVLQSLEGSTHVWTETGNLELFYEKVEREEVLNVPHPPAMERPLRSPLKVVLDYL